MLISHPCKFDVNLLKLMESHSIYSEMRSASGGRLTQLQWECTEKHFSMQRRDHLDVCDWKSNSFNSHTLQ